MYKTIGDQQKILPKNNLHLNQKSMASHNFVFKMATKSGNLCHDQHLGRVIISSRDQHNSHEVLTEGGLLPQRVSFQMSRSSGYKQHLGRNVCQKNNFSRFHRDSVKGKFRLLLLPNKPKTLFQKSRRSFPEPKKGPSLLILLKLQTDQ